MTAIKSLVNESLYIVAGFSCNSTDNYDKIFGLTHYGKFVDKETGVFVDTFGYAKREKKMVKKGLYARSVDADWIVPLKPADFLGSSTWIPNKPKPLLSNYYAGEFETRPPWSIHLYTQVSGFSLFLLFFFGLVIARDFLFALALTVACLTYGGVTRVGLCAALLVICFAFKKFRKTRFLAVLFFELSAISLWYDFRFPAGEKRFWLD
jgi:hypothetical protein